MGYSGSGGAAGLRGLGVRKSGLGFRLQVQKDNNGLRMVAHQGPLHYIQGKLVFGSLPMSSRLGADGSGFNVGA